MVTGDFLKSCLDFETKYWVIILSNAGDRNTHFLSLGSNLYRYTVYLLR